MDIIHHVVCFPRKRILFCEKWIEAISQDKISETFITVVISAFSLSPGLHSVISACWVTCCFGHERCECWNALSMAGGTVRNERYFAESVTQCQSIEKARETDEKWTFLFFVSLQTYCEITVSYKLYYPAACLSLAGTKISFFYQ